jgi:glycosyltransferase involved in cell wall biosynthesis
MAERARHLLVDARPIEHPTARRRGIGRYTTGILQGLDEVGVSVTALVADSAQAELIRPQVPNVDVAVWSPDVVRAHATTGAWYLATGLFLHPVSFDPIPVTITRAGLPVAGIMYDVIPYRYPERYLADPSARRMAELRKPLARTVDVVLAISEFAASTSIAALGLAPERVRSIGAGVEPRFAPAPRGTARPASVPAQEYVVCVTGTDEHKNTAGLIEAWGQLPRTVRHTYRLVIVGKASDAVRTRWEREIERAGCADSIDLTGGVTDEHLVELLQHAALSVTPSFEEGFGLPVLEAAACGCPVITSDRGALPEVLDEPASRFDPDEPRAIAAAIEQALLDDHHRNHLLAAASRAAARWTWPYVAINALDAIDAVAPTAVLDERPMSAPATSPASVLLVYEADMAPVGEQVAAAIGELPGSPEVWQAVHVAGTDQSSRPTAHRSPAGAVGRYPKVHEFDQVVVLGDATVPAAVSAALRLLPPFDVAPVAALLPAG